MEVEHHGGKSFSYLKIALAPGESINAESDAMASMDTGIDLRAHFNGGFFTALLLKFFGKESFFKNSYHNEIDRIQEIFLTQKVPGEITSTQLAGDRLYLQAGAYIASTSGIKMNLAWAGFSSWLAGEGLLRLRLHGAGTVWYGAYGAVEEREIDGEYIVDSGHLLSYDETITLKAKLSGGIFSSFFSGEGIVLRLKGKGKIKLQTRSIGGVAGWLNPKFWKR